MNNYYDINLKKSRLDILKIKIFFYEGKSGTKKIKFKIGLRRPDDCKHLVANLNKFMKILPWNQKYNDLEYILKTEYEWEKN